MTTPDLEGPERDTGDWQSSSFCLGAAPWPEELRAAAAAVQEDWAEAAWPGSPLRKHNALLDGEGEMLRRPHLGQGQTTGPEPPGRQILVTIMGVIPEMPVHMTFF